MTETTRYVNNPQLDKWVTWALTGLAAAAFSIGAWFFNGLTETQKDLARAVSGLRTEVAVLQTQQANTRDLRERIKEIGSSLIAIKDEQSRRTSNVYRVESVSKRLEALERRVTILEEAK